ncbi:MAG: cell division protein FtsZ [Acidobacteria bacterium]|nr:cell division protein FtsZ [Acidobacteriota bacterium]MBI3472867.1 cell division protein FtsZ [Candidatus Solibacter usitatus]
MSLLDPDIEELKYEIAEEEFRGARIKVVGVGGGGSNAVARMIHEGLGGVEFHILNTDSQALASSPAPNKLRIGAKITHGLGAGADPAIGRQAALDDTDKICEILEGADMVFVTAGLGGGTGTGAAPVVASLAKELGALTVAVVTKPFGFEGQRRGRQAEQGLAELAATIDTVIAIPNDRLLSLAPRGTSFLEAFRIADDILRQAVQGISDIIVTPGLINRDFSDIRVTMSGMGYAMMGTAMVSGENAAIEAARQAINCPLLEDSRIRGSRGILINITGSSRLGLHEVNEACSIIREAADCEDVQINFGVILNESMGDAVKITVIATGFQPENSPAPAKRPAEVSAARTTPIPEARPAMPPPIAPPIPPPVALDDPPAAYAAPSPAPPMPSQIRPLPPAPVQANFDPEDLETPAYLRQGKLLN